MLLILGIKVRLIFLEFSCHVDWQMFWQASIFVYGVLLYPQRLLALFAWVSEMCLPALYFARIATLSRHSMHNTTIPKVVKCDYLFYFLSHHCQFFTFLKNKTMQWLEALCDVYGSKFLKEQFTKTFIYSCSCRPIWLPFFIWVCFRTMCPLYICPKTLT